VTREKKTIPPNLVTVKQRKGHDSKGGRGGESAFTEGGGGRAEKRGGESTENQANEKRKDTRPNPKKGKKRAGENQRQQR